jgi:hypothetical protein
MRKRFLPFCVARDHGIPNPASGDPGGLRAVESANIASAIEEPLPPADQRGQWKCRSATLSKALP